MNRLLLAGGALALSVSCLRAQDAGVTMRARGQVRIEATTTATALFTVTNERADSIQLMPHADAPVDWKVLTGAATMTVAPHASETLVLSLSVPARARAGVYPIRVSLTTPTLFSLVMDSVLVVVPERRAIQLELLERPAYAVSARPYDAVFLLRNRGNAATDVQLQSKSRLGVVELTPHSLVRLEPDEAREIHVRVRSRAPLEGADDDVIEIAARALEDSAQQVTASARVMVVPQALRIDDYDRLPAQLRLRTGEAPGVAPFEVAGAGPLRTGGDVEVDFLLRGRGRTSHVFGEYDEYRIAAKTNSWHLRAGDHAFTLSPLTGAGRPGFGLGGELTALRWSGGAFAQTFRREPFPGGEAGAFLSARPFQAMQLGLNALGRQLPDGLMTAIGTQATLQHRGERADLELVRSASGSRSGLAANARLTGAHRRVSYDAGLLNADTSFAGVQPGARNAYVSASAQPAAGLGVSFNASRRSHAPIATDPRTRFQFDLASAAVTFARRLTAEATVAGRSTSATAASGSQQRSVRLRADQRLGALALALGVTRGVTLTSDMKARSHGEVHASARMSRRIGALSGFLAVADGGSLINGPERVVTTGGDAALRVRRQTDLSASFFATRTGASPWNSRLDARVQHALPVGSTVTMRVRITTGDATSREQSGVFLEYALPLKLPVARTHTPGRVEGRILDAESGRGIPNALVRVGGQVALTDSRGQVAFSHVPAGAHRVSLAQEHSLSDAVFIGDPTVSVGATASRPSTFQLRLARGARLDVVINRFVSVRTAVNGGPDSVVLSRPESDVTLRLVSGRDTLFRHSDDRGRVSFTDIAPGTWVVTVHSETPSRHRYEPDRVEVALAPGESRRVELRLLPRQREVQVIGGDQELKSMPRDGVSKSRER